MRAVGRASLAGALVAAVARGARKPLGVGLGAATATAVVGVMSLCGLGVRCWDLRDRPRGWAATGRPTSVLLAAGFPPLPAAPCGLQPASSAQGQGQASCTAGDQQRCVFISLWAPPRPADG